MCADGDDHNVLIHGIAAISHERIVDWVELCHMFMT